MYIKSTCTIYFNYWFHCRHSITLSAFTSSQIIFRVTFHAYISCRVVWLTLIIFSLSYFCYASSLFLSDFSKKKVNTKVRVETAEELQVSQLKIHQKYLTWIHQAHSSNKLSTLLSLVKSKAANNLLLTCLYNDQIQNNIASWTSLCSKSYTFWGINNCNILGIAKA